MYLVTGKYTGTLVFEIIVIFLPYKENGSSVYLRNLLKK